MFTHILLDVDGTLTDSSVIYSDNGTETKTFSIRDGIGFAVARECGIRIIVIAGRACDVTERRMKELKAAEIHQGIVNKYDFVRKYLEENHPDSESVCYMGDDINDYYAMDFAGFVACPDNACDEVKEKVDYVCKAPGGKGAFRDLIEHIVGKEKWMETTETVWTVSVMIALFLKKLTSLII